MTFEHFNPFALSDQTQQCPYDLYAQMRAQDGLASSDECNGFHAVTRYDDVREVLLDGENFSVAEGVGLLGPVGFIMPESDGDLHHRYRRIVNPWFRRGAVDAREADIRAVASKLLDSLLGRHDVEFVTEVCRPLIGLVNSKVVLTVDDEHFDPLQEMIADVIYDLSKARAGLKGIKAFASADIARRRHEAPRGDALDDVIHDTGDAALSDDEVLQVYLSLLFGAFDTTANTLAVAFAYLAQHPDARTFLREDPARIPAAIEEFVRWDPTSQGMARTVRNDVTVGGQHLRPGDRLFICSAAANRDGDQFVDADTVDLSRTPNRHMGFGAGPHRCVGVHLANLLMRVAVDEVLQRWPDMSLTPGTQLRYKTTQMRAMVALPIVLDPEASRSTGRDDAAEK
jgi:cytochrome P450